MTLVKSDLVNSVMENVRFKRGVEQGQRYLFPEMDCEFLTRQQARELVDALIEMIKRTLSSGEDVLITGFGKFQVKYRWARKGRNPQTGEPIILDSRRVIVFKPSNKLRQKMNPPNP